MSSVCLRLPVTRSLAHARALQLVGPVALSHARSLEWPGGGSPGGRGSEGGSDGGSVKGPCGLMDKALAFGTKDCRLESCQGHICYWHRAAHHRRRIGFSLASRASGQTTGSEQHHLHGARRQRGKMAPCHAQHEQRAWCARRSGRAGSDSQRFFHQHAAPWAVCGAAVECEEERQRKPTSKRKS